MDAVLVRLGAEVRQGLHHILGLIELASEEPLSETQLNYLGGCREAADQLRRTADDLTELARPPRSITAAAFNFKEAIEEISELMGALAERKGLSFHALVDTSIPGRVLGDKYLLQDMLRRVLDNAIRFTTSGSIRLRVGCGELQAERVLVTFEISDTGSGISAEVLDEFETPLNDLQIQGLSLRVLRKRLEGLQGSMSLAGNHPQGTTVTLKIPLHVPIAAPVEPTVPAQTSALAPLRILLAEDSNDSFTLFKSYVKSEGHQVFRALDGVQALEMVQSDEYDYIVMDVNMPRMDGYSATRLIREWETDQGRPRLPILLLSADDLERQMRLGGAAGCSGFLAKPTTKKRVLAALNYYAKRSEQPQTLLH